MAQYLTLPNGSQFEVRQGETREQALSKALQQYPEAFGFGPATPEAKPESGFIPSVKRGFMQTGMLLGDVLPAMAGRAVGANEYADRQLAEAAATQKEIQAKYPSAVPSFTDIKGGGDLVTYITEAVGEAIPSLIPSLFTGGAAAILGRTAVAAAKEAAEKAALSAVAKGVAKEEAEKIAMQAGVQAARSTALKYQATGAVAGSAAQNVPEVFQNILQETGKEDIGAALVGGGFNAVLDAVLPIQLLRKAKMSGIPESEIIGAWYKRGAVGLGKGFLTEGGTESVQEMSSAAAVKFVDNNKDFFTPENFVKFIDAGLKGGVGGGVISGASDIAFGRSDKAVAEDKDLAAAFKQREEDAKKREADVAQRATPEGQLAFVQDYEARQVRFQELNAIPKPDKDATPLQQAEYAEVKKEKNELGKGLFRDSAEYKKSLAAAQGLKEEQRVGAMTPLEYQMEQFGVNLGQDTTAAPTSPSEQQFNFSTLSDFTPPPKQTPVTPVNQYVAQQLQLANRDLYTTPEAADYVAYLMQNPAMAAQITTETPMPGLSNAERNAVTGAIGLQIQQQAKQSLQPRVEDLAGQIPKKVVGKRKAPDYDAYLQDLETLDFDRREGLTDADVARLAKLRRQTDVTDQGEMFGQSSQQTVLGGVPKTQQELFADLRIARAAGDRKAVASIINSLRVVQRNDDAAAEKAKSSQQRFVLSGEQREELSAKGLSEEEIDEQEEKAQKSLGQSLGAGQMSLATALQQTAAASRADAFSEVVDLVNRFNKGAAKQEQLNAAKERLVSGLLMDIRQSRREPLTDEETQGITRSANELLRELTERFGDTRSLSQKGDNFVPAQTSTGEFRTDKVPGMGFPTVESRMPGRQTFSSPFAAAQSIREGLEELRTRAITVARPATYTRKETPREVSAESVDMQLRRELAKDPKTHSAEQRSLLVAIADNLRMMMRPETRQDVSSWLYDLARDPKNVPDDKTQAVRDALQAVEQAKLSNQDQLGLPLGPGKKLRQEAPETEGKPTPVKEGSFSQVSFEPEYEDVTSPVFNSYAQLKQYLASDALQEIRSALGLGRPTADRLEQRLKPFATRVALYMSRLSALKTRADELNKRVQELQVSKRGQLKELKAMSATDMAQETQALNEARRNLAELRTRMSELEAPLRKELEPLLKEFDKVQKQFDAAVAAEEKLTAAMLTNNRLFGDRELAALQKLQNVQQRIKNARSKLYKEIEADFGSDPRNLARMMREFKDSGKQGAFTEQLAAAHKELYDVFFDTRKDDTAIHQYLKTAAKLDAQIQIQADKIDAMGEKLLNAGLKLEVIRDSQVEVAENRDEILDAKQQTQDAQQALRALEAKQRERLDALEKLEAELGLTRTEIPHRLSESTTVAEVLRAANDSEKALIQQRIEAEAELNKAAAPVKALFYFDGQRATARAKKPETAAQTQDRDAQRQRLLEAIGRDPASFEGQRISFEKRRALAEEFRTEKARREELEALIAASDEAVPYVRQQIAEAEKTLKSIDQEIAQVEAANKKRPRSFQAKLEQQSAMVALGPLREARARFAKGVERFTADIATYEREKATAQSNLATLEDRTAELAALFSADPEVQKARTEAIDARIAKVEKNITNQTAKLQEKGIKASTRDSRERELRKSRKELQRLTAQRSAKYGIVRTSLADVGRPEDAVAEEGERLGARKAGPVVRPTRTAGNIRTGTLETTGERTLSTRSKITQIGQTKTETSEKVQAVGNAASAERAAAQPEKTATQLAVEEVQQQQQILAAKERLEAGIRAQLADLDIRLDALRRSQRPNITVIGDLEAQKQVMQRELAAARMDLEREGALAAEAQKIVDTTSTVGGIIQTRYAMGEGASVAKVPQGQAEDAASLLPNQRLPAFKTRLYADGRREQVPRTTTPAPAATTPDALAQQYRVAIDASAAFNGMTFAQAARYGAKRTTSPMVRQLFEKLADVFEQAPADQQGVVYAADGPLTMANGQKAAGIFANRFNAILTVAPSVRAGANKTLLHELTHAATVRGMLADKALDARITDLRERVKAWLETPAGRAYFRNNSMELQATNRQDVYGLTNNQEFLAELFADRGFQKMLTAIPSDKPRASIFTRFVQSLSKFFNMPGEAAQSAFAEAVALTEEVLLVTTQQIYKTPTAADIAGNDIADAPLLIKQAQYSSPEWTSAGQDIRKVIAGQRSWGDKIKANATGLAFETQLVDRFAAFERLRKYMPEQMGTQMMYYLRMYDQRMNFVSQAVSNGALRLVEKIRPDGKKEYVIESKEGANISNVVQILRGALQYIGNAEAVNQAFTTYLAARRAERVGLDKLNFGDSVTQEMLDRTMRLVNGNDKLKDVFEKARREYNTYNRDLIAMVASTGAISKETEAALTRSDDYIPFYRAQNGIVELLIGGEAPMRIGSIAEQPYLQELVGGDQPILDFMTSSVQNTNMLVDMALRNLATKNAVFELVSLGAAKIVAGKPAGRDVVQFKVDGQDRYAVVSSETVTIGGKTFETGVPADILVKGMEGIPTQMPFLFRAMAMPAQLLRKAVTLSPLYQAKALFRDSLAAPILSGADFTPVLGALRQIGKESGKTLEQRGITGGQYMTGTTDDLTKILRDIADGKPGWMTALSKAEAIGMKTDALTRRAQYNSYIEQGLSEMEATLMALESMNFNKRGASPSIHIANALIPFFNAQIQGLNVMYKAMSGQMPFNDKLKIQQKLLIRGGMMAAVTLLYAALMEDDEAYKNATPAEKYGNWFVRIPGVDQPIRVPIPFEIGYFFKALPEAIYNSMTDKNGGEDAVKAFKQILLQSIPGGSSYGIPQIMKPAIEAGLGKSFYTGRDILSAREKELLPEDQFRANTAEVSKVIGKALGLSPIIMENLVRGYTGTMGLAFLHAVSLGTPKSESPEAAVKRLSDFPIIGGAFQPNDAGGITNTVYERFNESIQVRNSYKKMLTDGRTADANSLLQRRGNELLEAEIGDVFKQNMNKLTQAERAIAASTMTPEQKRTQLDDLRKLKTAFSQTMRNVADKAVKLSSPL